ncbi:MAG: hypothetical protein OHK0046_14910 [Anaerolineae bacterium]
MTTSRRDFLKLAAGITAAAAGIGVPAVLLILSQQEDAPPFFPGDAATTEALAASVTDAEAIATMMHVAEAVFINQPITRSTYESFYTYCAAHVPGYAETYRQFAALLNAAAERTHDTGYADLTLAARREMLAPGLALLESGFSPTESIQPEWDIYTRRVLMETINLFMYRDAWLVLGYPQWPGMPRGLESYQQPFGGEA